MFGVDNVSCVGLSDKNVHSAGPRVRDSKQQSLIRKSGETKGNNKRPRERKERQSERKNKTKEQGVSKSQ